MNFKTIAIHAGHDPQAHLGAVMPPIFQTSTFAFKGVGQPGPFDYSRSGNPTRKALETCLAALEGGAAGFAFATGLPSGSQTMPWTFGMTGNLTSACAVCPSTRVTVISGCVWPYF